MNARLARALATAGMLAAAGCSGAARERSAWPGCDAFPEQLAAQRAWESAGRPLGSDGDADGRVCEALASRDRPSSGLNSPRGGQAKTSGCQRTSRVVSVGLNRTRYRHILHHIQTAVRRGWPAVLAINREGASERRERMLEGVRTRPGYDRDEWPMAFARRSYRADVAYVPSAENRSAGAVVGIKLGGFCDGTRFRVVGY